MDSLGVALFSVAIVLRCISSTFDFALLRRLFAWYPRGLQCSERKIRKILEIDEVSKRRLRLAESE
jgi:hypothetical protein